MLKAFSRQLLINGILGLMQGARANEVVEEQKSASAKEKKA